MSTAYKTRMERKLPIELSVFLSPNKSDAEDKSIEEITEALNLDKKIIHISLTDSRDTMYKRIFQNLVESNIGEVFTEVLQRNNLLSKTEQDLVNTIVNNLINNLSYVCFDTLEISRINELLRACKYDKIIITASRYDKEVKRKCSMLCKVFNIDVKLNLFPTRKLI